VFPVPAPAAVSLLRGVPIYSSGIEAELVTPTGALLVSAYASSYGPVPLMTIDRIGYGAGDRDGPGLPNVLRVLVGDAGGQGTHERVVVLECEIDDMNPQLFGVLMERLYGAGALEVFFTPVQMKKNRPGTLVTVVAPPERRQSLSAIVFRETTTIGVRYQDVDRERLEREIVAVETPLGPVRFKIARLGADVVNAAPEFDDCVRLAAERGLPVKLVQAVAMQAYADRK
jgi:pyridinium-3,5-bisthiocarboxylic acid mononucleotide nickel chelatase